MERLVARIGKPHGLRGEVTLRLHTDEPEERFATGAVLRTEAEPGSGVPLQLTVATARDHQGVWLVSFDQVPDRTGAEGLRGVRLLCDVPDGDRAERDTADDEDAWYEDELVGLIAVDPAGERFGEVVGLTVGGAQDLLEISLDAGARALVPFVTQIVPVVDIDAGRIVIDAPPGLLELGAS
jgi:16S rRNA processing protein RimM